MATAATDIDIAYLLMPDDNALYWQLSLGNDARAYDAGVNGPNLGRVDLEKLMAATASDETAAYLGELTVLISHEILLPYTNGVASARS